MPSKSINLPLMGRILLIMFFLGSFAGGSVYIFAFGG
jgi:hypothetical protein